MLVEFSVKNFASIKNEITFSMVAGSGDENLENTIKSEKNNEKYLRTTAIYGANASGKTSIGRMLMIIFNFISKSFTAFGTSPNESIIKINRMTFFTNNN